MTLIIYKILAALFIFLVSVVAIIYPLRKNVSNHTESISLGEALASGIFLGVAFFHMLPDAIKIFAQYDPTISYPVPEAICIAGFLVLLFLERIALLRSPQRAATSIPYILIIILTFHALMEGAALGIGATFAETVMIFVAILAHKMSETFALCMIMLRHKLPTQRVVLVILFFACMTPLGIALGGALNQLTLAKGALIAGIFDAFAAGTFLYISTLHHLHFHQHNEEMHGLQEFACLLLGLCTMALIALWS